VRIAHKKLHTGDVYTGEPCANTSDEKSIGEYFDKELVNDPESDFGEYTFSNVGSEYETPVGMVREVFESLNLVRT
jgi:hypothetical protein